MMDSGWNGQGAEPAAAAIHQRISRYRERKGRTLQSLLTFSVGEPHADHAGARREPADCQQSAHIFQAKSERYVLTPSGPGEVGLLEVIHPGVALPQQHLAELIQQRRRGGGDGTLADGHAQHGLVAAFLRLEAGRVRTQKFQQRNSVDARHLPRIGHELPCRAAPDHHRRHHESGAGGEIIEPTEDGIRPEGEPHLLFEFPQGTLFRRLAGVEAAPGQCPLARMTTQVLGTSGQDQRRLAAPRVMDGKTVEIRTKALLHHGERHCGVQAFIDKVLARIEAPEALAKQRPQIGITNHGLKHFAKQDRAHSIAGHRWSVTMTAKTMSTASLIQHCMWLDELLGNHGQLWRSNVFRDPQPAWLAEHPRLAAAVLDLSEAELEHLEADPEALLELLGPHVPTLPATLSAIEPPWDRAELPGDIPFANLHVPGRKWAQIRHFMAALPPATTPAVDWSAGKGHLGRSVARLHGRTVRCLERDPTLCAAGEGLAAGLPVTFERCNVLDEPTHLQPGDTVMALHACGALHEHLLDQAVATGVARVDLAPCCYHLTTRWQARADSAADPRFHLEDLHLAVQDLVTAPARVRRARLKERAFRAAFDDLQRQLRGYDSYLPQPSVKGAERRLDFPGFCALMAQHHGLELPRAADLSPWLEKGWIRDARSRRLDLARQGFRRALELRIVLDRTLFLAEAGYAVNLRRFCLRALTPRNLLIEAWR